MNSNLPNNRGREGREGEGRWQREGIEAWKAAARVYQAFAETCGEGDACGQTDLQT